MLRKLGLRSLSKVSLAIVLGIATVTVGSYPTLADKQIPTYYIYAFKSESGKTLTADLTGICNHNSLALFRVKTTFGGPTLTGDMVLNPDKFNCEKGDTSKLTGTFTVQTKNKTQLCKGNVSVLLDSGFGKPDTKARIVWNIDKKAGTCNVNQTRYEVVVQPIQRE